MRIKNVYIEIDDDTHAALKSHCAKIKVSMKDFVANLIREALKKGSK